MTAEETSSEESQLEDVLDHSVTDVLTHHSSLSEFFATGGTMNYFIGLYGTRNYGIIVPPSLMQKLVQARIEIQLDVYPSKSAASPHEEHHQD